ncbi:ABC transporter permease [Aquimarina sp. D1M17]|uniref:ABC transporter permease n=1 Tax=Aquimarina acroporae TaxID=2937283 RepID=UPI0020BE5BFB|nr:ABC transporter permease [Aquimarina acroporae]MCK8524322.1 ABC transporter permease [Aquimarina acroporae]
MLKLNFLLVIRQLKKDKKSFLINVLGSSIGLTAIVLMALYINYEDNYDSFNENKDRLFRVERIVDDKIQSQLFDSAPYELAGELKNKFPEITNASSARTTSNYLSIGDELYPQEKGLVVDQAFLNMLSFNFINGDKNNALKRPMSIVLSSSLANKLFPNGDGIGKPVRVNKKSYLTVTGVFEDYPKNSHLSMEYMISFNSYEGLYGIKETKGWDTNYSGTYILVDGKAKQDILSSKMKNFLTNYVKFNDGTKQTLSLRPVTDVYLKTLSVRNSVMGGIRNNVIVIYLFVIVAFFTAFVTSVNYINLTTTQLINRELEIGMKKVLGISKTQLRYQFVAESLIMVFSVILISTVFLLLILPLFSSIVDRDLSLAFTGSSWFFLKIFIGSIVFGFLGGLYPVFYLASLKITSFLQGNTSIKRRNYLRKGLVLFQLFITIPLIFLSIYTISQIKFLNEKDVGFEKENLLLAWVEVPEMQDQEQLQVLKNTLLRNPNVLSYSISEAAPFFASGEEVNVNWEGSDSNDKIRLTSYGVDYDFVNTFEMSLKKGRWFSKDFSTDNISGCIINETAASMLGWKDPIGKTIDNGRLKVVGVVKDFNQFSLFQEIPPMMLTMNTENMKYAAVSVKVNANGRTETRRAINSVFNSTFRETPIEFQFLDEGFDEGFMTALENVMKIFILFSVISVVLVIIGLFSLISFSLKMQKKMIAIRKILGASTKGLFMFILKEYIVLYGIAMILSLILTYFAIQQISQTFAYSVEVGPLDYLNVICITLFIVLATISGKIWSASVDNPINAINHE